MNHWGMLWVMLSCLVGVGISIAAIWTQSLVSATSMLVLTNANKFVVILLELFCMPEAHSITHGQTLGAFTAIVATVLYARSRDFEEKAAKAIAGLESDIEKYEANHKEKTIQRKKDHEEYLVEQKDYAESVDAVGRALEVMNDNAGDVPAGAAALLQLSDKNRMPAKVRSIVQAFVDMGDMDDAGVPEANAYESQSGGIIDMLKKLQDDFRQKLAETEKAEMNSEHAFNMLSQDLTDSISFAKKDISEKSKEKGSKTEQSADDERQLAATTNTKAASEKTLEVTSIECKEKGLSFDEKQQLRDEEMEAIAKAVEILSSPDVAGQHEKHLQLAQEQVSGASLAQLRAAVGVASPRVKVRQFLTAEGRRLKSKGLELLAQKMEANPFAKVTKMIDQMITRLLEEANADANHEGFCDAEIGKSKITRTKLQEDIDGLGAAVDEGKAKILHHGNQISMLSKQVSELDASMQEAAAQRKAEKVQAAQTVEEAQLAQEKVQQATAVLKDFYAKAAGATGFVQTATTAEGVKMGSEQWNSLANPAFSGEVDLGHKKGMQTFGAKNTGQQDSAGGVLALLEVILSDFANLEADTTASEDQAQRAYEEFVTASNKEKAVAEKQMEMDSEDKVSAEARLQEDTADWKATQDELLAAERYYDKLVPQCMDPGQSFEERTAAREAEITSLKEALTILGSEDIETSA
jgi:hypothetical protein